MKQIILLAICAFSLLSFNMRLLSSDDLSISSDDTLSDMILQSSDDLSISSEDTLSDLGPNSIIDAIMMGDDIDEIKNLIKNGADVNLQDAIGNTALIWAADFGYNDIAKLLLDNNADVDIQSKKGYTALMYGARFKHKEIVKMLLRHGADVNIKNHEGLTALDLARGDSEIVELLRKWLQK